MNPNWQDFHSFNKETLKIDSVPVRGLEASVQKRIKRSPISALEHNMRPTVQRGECCTGWGQAGAKGAHDRDS